QIDPNCGNLVHGWLPSLVTVYSTQCGTLRCRKRVPSTPSMAQPLATMNTLALQVQQGLGRDPHAGEIFCFRGRKGDLVKILWHDGVGTSLYLKRLEAAQVYLASQSHGRRGSDIRSPARLSSGRN
ncbi:IS66 family insertion sequence element accessory protein TnpB, partial [Pseudoruegeria sp. SK021]|uniref:IS66 family insertion sequence element accessory protein TnpB n=1 Tax=Pseudoruegeria sp. SK021 TaxID=1933035 RepID=UPI00197DEEF0